MGGGERGEGGAQGWRVENAGRGRPGMEGGDDTPRVEPLAPNFIANQDFIAVSACLKNGISKQH